MHGLCCIYLAYVLTFCVVGESHKPLLRGSGFLAAGNMFDFDVVLFAGKSHPQNIETMQISTVPLTKQLLFKEDIVSV